jgi:hypothetical protein
MAKFGRVNEGIVKPLHLLVGARSRRHCTKRHPSGVSVPVVSNHLIKNYTGGPPTPTVEQADNDLVGRIIDYISHSNVWSSSAIFLEEDDSQNGVDHVDGHRRQFEDFGGIGC